MKWISAAKPHICFFWNKADLLFGITNTGADSLFILRSKQDGIFLALCNIGIALANKIGFIIHEGSPLN